MTNTRKDEQEKDKAVRTPLGGLRLKMQLAEADQKEFERRHMVPRWINDRDGRISAALAGGYTFVEPKHAMSLGQSALHEGNTDIGSRVSRVVTKGNDLVMSAFLMEIPKDIYDEDQKAKQDRILESEKGLIEGRAGGANIENAYYPSGSGQAVTFTR